MNEEYYKSLLEDIRQSSIRRSKVGKEVIDTQQLQKQEMIKQSLPDPHRTYIRGSEIGDCIRQLYFRLIGVEKDANPHPYPYLNIAAKIGDVIHETILGDEEIYLLNEYAFEYDEFKLSIHGRIDGITRDGIVVELKTIDDIYRTDLPIQKHIDQLSIYTYIARRIITELDIAGAELKYVARGKINVRSFPFTLEDTEHVAKILIAKITDLSNHLVNRKVPSLNNQFINVNNCKYCEFASTCQKLGKG